jgi:hypothetical protein
VKNYAHAVAMSNSKRAIKIADGDRRWLIPGVTEIGKPKGTTYWVDFNEWLRTGGLAAIAAWAHDYVEKHGPVQPGAHAPTSAAKKQVIEENHSDGERMVYELAQDLFEAGQSKLGPIGDGPGQFAVVEHGERIVMRRDEIRLWLADRKAALNPSVYGREGQMKLESAEKIAATLRECELVVPEDQFKADGQRFRIVANFGVGAKPKWADLKPFYMTVAEFLKKKNAPPM